MFKKGSKFMDDLARMAGGTAGLFNSFRKEIQEDVKERVDMMVDRLDLVPRQDLEKLEKRVAKLEEKAGVAKKADATKAAPKKTTTKIKTATTAKAKATATATAKPKAKTAKSATPKKSTKAKAKAPIKKTATKKTTAKKSTAKK